MRSCCDMLPSTAVFTREYGMCYAPDALEDHRKSGWDGVSRDLSIIKNLGATMIRLYGSDVEMDYTAFLDEAEAFGVRVVVALPDFLRTASHEACATTAARDCSETTQHLYEQMLSKGLTTLRIDGQRYYHPAIKAIVLANEPERNFNRDSISEGHHVQALISAFDGVLTAERSMRIATDGVLPPFTVTHSFASCADCPCVRRGDVARDAIGVPFMYDFAAACLRPGSHDYTPHPLNDLEEALQHRFVLGLNTHSDANAICVGALMPLALSFLGNLPLWVGEYKARSNAGVVHIEELEQQLREVRALVEGTNQDVARHCGNTQLNAISFFQFQVVQDIDPSDYSLRQKRNVVGESLVATMAKVFGGTASRVPSPSAVGTVV